MLPDIDAEQLWAMRRDVASVVEMKQRELQLLEQNANAQPHDAGATGALIFSSIFVVGLFALAAHFAAEDALEKHRQAVLAAWVEAASATSQPRRSPHGPQINTSIRITTHELASLQVERQEFLRTLREVRAQLSNPRISSQERIEIYKTIAVLSKAIVEVGRTGQIALSDLIDAMWS